MSEPLRATTSQADDEAAIRKLVDTWLAATMAGDIATVLSLMTDDVVFMVPGREPFGRQAFAAASDAMKNVRMEGKSDIRELRVLGDHAYIRNYLEITITPEGGAPVKRTGWTLAILRKEEGRWRLARDANLLINAPSRSKALTPRTYSADERKLLPCHTYVMEFSMLRLSPH